MYLKNGYQKIITKFQYRRKKIGVFYRQIISYMYTYKIMNGNWTKPTIEELGDASDLILGASGSNIKDDNLDDGFTREGISIGQS